MAVLESPKSKKTFLGKRGITGKNAVLRENLPVQHVILSLSSSDEARLGLLHIVQHSVIGHHTHLPFLSHSVH